MWCSDWKSHRTPHIMIKLMLCTDMGARQMVSRSATRTLRRALLAAAIGKYALAVGKRYKNTKALGLGNFGTLL